MRAIADTDAGAGAEGDAGAMGGARCGASAVWRGVRMRTQLRVLAASGELGDELLQKVNGNLKA